MFLKGRFAVAPSATDTGMLRAVLTEGAEQQIREKTLLGGRLGGPDDIAAVVAFLAGPEAAWIAG
ncbi:MAG: SDR family oxidoreductase [Kiloniellales bacterium]|nr:SDR family oxidoreductase [Kiloniellales bacterium]